MGPINVRPIDLQPIEQTNFTAIARQKRELNRTQLVSMKALRRRRARLRVIG